jgi:prepilin-type N-terminal cleavage/methylation domain-containing protein
MASDRGFSLVEVIVCAGVLAAVLMLGGPPLLRASGDLRLRVAAAEAASVLRSARSLAVRYGAHVAVRFRAEADGRASYAVYRDGDGDGVLSRDIASGADPLVRRPALLGDGHAVLFGFPPGRPALDPGDRSRLLQPEDPIRFNRSDLASFGPVGESTPGSLYLTDGESRLAVVRVFGRTGKIRVLTYDFAARLWR